MGSRRAAAAARFVRNEEQCRYAWTMYNALQRFRLRPLNFTPEVPCGLIGVNILGYVARKMVWICMCGTAQRTCERSRWPVLHISQEHIRLYNLKTLEYHLCPYLPLHVSGLHALLHHVEEYTMIPVESGSPLMTN